MRIALVVTEFPAVSQTFVLDHLRGLLARGHSVDIQARRPGKDSAEHAEIAALQLRDNTHYLAPVPQGRWALGRDLLRRALGPLLRRPLLAARLLRGDRAGRWQRLYAALPFWDCGADYQLLHAHSGQNGLRLLPLFDAGLLRGRLVVTFHGQDVHGYLRQRRPDLYTPLFARADALVVCSTFMRERLLALGAPAAKLHCIPNAIEPERIAWRERQPPGSEPVQLLSIGRLVPFKGLVQLLEALAKPALASTALQLHLVGDGPLQTELRGRAEALGLGERVQFHGAQPREVVLGLLDRCDLYLAPAVIDAEGNTETQGVALLEAMAAGLPVIASAVGGIPETLGEAAAALVPAGDADTLALAIRDHVARPQAWPALSRAGRQRVLEHYQHGQWLDRLEALYQSLTQKPQSNNP